MGAAMENVEPEGYDDIPDMEPDAGDLMPERRLPHNLEAEQSVLGGLLLAPDRFDVIEGRVDADDFFSRAYATIFEAMQALQKRGQPLDILVLKDELANEGKLDFVGGAAALLTLSERVPTGAHVEHYAQIVRDRAIQRRLIQAATQIVRQASGQEGMTSTDLLDEAERAIFEVAERGVSAEPASMREVIKETWEKIEKFSAGHGTVTGLPTGYYELDKMLTGLHEDELIIIAARPSMGKSTFALNLARHIGIEEGCPIVVYSLEMSDTNIAQNILCAHAHVDAQRLRTGHMGEQEWGHLARSSDALSNAPIFVDDTPSISIAELRGKTRRLKARHGLGLCIIDYLQLVTASSKASQRSREQEISEISRGLKALAKELSIPVIALSQLNRKATDRADNRPILSDLRESGAIEQDADVVMLLHRPDYYDPEDAPGQAEVIIAKQRNGPTGTVQLAFIRNQLRFENLSLRPDGDRPADIGGGEM